MGLEKVFCGLEVRKDGEVTGVEAPAQVQNGKRQELNGIKSWVDRMMLILQIHRPDSSFSEERSLLEFDEASAVGGATLREDEERVECASFFYKPLSILYRLKCLSSAFLRSTSGHVYGVQAVDEGIKEGHFL